MFKTFKLFLNLLFTKKIIYEKRWFGKRFSEPNSQYIIGSVDTILESAKKVYEEELARFNQIENKTNIGMAFSGVLLGVIITFYSSNGIKELDNNFYNVSFGIIKLLNLVFVFRAIYFFNQSMKSNTYNQFPINTIIDYKYFKKQEDVLKIELASTYNRVIKENQELLKNKIKQYDDGNRSTFLGFIFFIIIFVLEMTIKFYL